LRAFWEWLTVDAITVFNGLLVIVTGGLVWVGWRQVRLTKNIADRQVRDTETLQRAYVNAEPRGIKPMSFDRDDRVVGRVALRNVGHLPARNVSYSASIGYPLNSSGHDFPIAPIEPRKGVLPPGAEIVVDTGNVLFTDKVTNSTFVWGMVTYDDGFGNSRFSKFCFVYGTKEFINRGLFTIAGDRGRYYEDGNDAN
jgi:hypothetical protein